MVSILDIAPSSASAATVKVRGADVAVHGIGLDDVVYLIRNYPEIKDLFAGKDVHFTTETLFDRAPELVYSVIAAGTGVLKDVKGIDTVKGLALDEQVNLLDAILRETFKGGVVPFVQAVRRLTAVVSDVGTKASASSTPKVSKS